MISANQRAEWIVSIELEPFWTYSEVLFWILLQDVNRMADYLAQRPDCYYEAGPTAILASIEKLPINARTIFPATRLMAELKNGTIQATGIAEGGADRTPIPADQWLILKFGNAPADVKSGGIFNISRNVGLVAMPEYGIRATGYLPGGSRHSVLFDASSVKTAFSPSPASSLTSKRSVGSSRGGPKQLAVLGAMAQLGYGDSKPEGFTDLQLLGNINVHLKDKGVSVSLKTMKRALGHK